MSTRSSRRSLAACCVVLLAVDLLGAGAALRSARLTQPSTAAAAVAAATPTAVPTQIARDAARRRAVTELLAERSRAMLDRDRAAWLGTVDPADELLQAEQGSVFDNLTAVPLTSWAYELDPGTELALASAAAANYGDATTWLPSVRLRYAITGFDRVPASDAQVLTFVQRAGHWYLGGVDEAADTSQRSVHNLWDGGPVKVITGSRTMVLGHPAQSAEMTKLLADMQAAGPRIDAVWGPDWARKVVVEVPADAAEFQLLVGHGQYSAIAAVAKAELIGPSDDRTAVGERVLVNPPNYDQLNPLGRRVVLTHELTHVASRASSDASVPVWLVEGLADYVGYLGTTVSDRAAARELANDVAAGQLPNQLPGASDFNGANPKLAQSYEGAWLACRLIAQLAGPGETGSRGLVAFYRAVGELPGTDPDASVDTVLASRLHLTRAQFVDQWRQYLQDTLG